MSKNYQKKIVEHDLEFIKKADILIVLVDTPSFGTAIELFVAKNEFSFIHHLSHIMKSGDF